jgi:hypothetical protein
MASDKRPGQVPSQALQPEPRVFENKPASSLNEALKNSAKQRSKRNDPGGGGSSRDSTRGDPETSATGSHGGTG